MSTSHPLRTLPASSLAPYVSPIFVAYVRVDFNRLRAAFIEAVLAVLTRTRNPKSVTRLNIEVVRLEAGASEALKSSPVVVKRPTGFREGHAPNPCRTIQAL